MSQANQAVQVPTLSDMQKRPVPAAALPQGKTWLHLPSLVYMIALTPIPFLLAVWLACIPAICWCHPRVFHLLAFQITFRVHK